MVLIPITLVPFVVEYFYELNGKEVTYFIGIMFYDGNIFSLN
jgi:hypothetical protein